MKRYITKPRAVWVSELEEECPDMPALTVFEPDGEPQPTGILDAQGNELFRMLERKPIGFRSNG